MKQSANANKGRIFRYSHAIGFTAVANPSKVSEGAIGWKVGKIVIGKLFMFNQFEGILLINKKPAAHKATGLSCGISRWYYTLVVVSYTDEEDFVARILAACLYLQLTSRIFGRVRQNFICSHTAGVGIGGYYFE